MSLFFFFNDTATTEIYTLSLHDALPISLFSLSQERAASPSSAAARSTPIDSSAVRKTSRTLGSSSTIRMRRSEEHTSELQSRQYLVCRLLLEKKNNATI